MIELSTERMASPPAPVPVERIEKKASQTSTKENIDRDCEGKKLPETTSEKNSQHEDEDEDVDEEEKKEPTVTTEAESQENDSKQTVKDSQEKENKSSELTENEEKQENVTSKVKDTAATDSDGEEKVEEEKSVESKLDAEALSASLSSSRCLLKRNRDDLELDSDGDNQEEPDCKKSHTASAAAVKTGEKEEDDGTEEKDIGTPVVVEKSMLPPAELVASLSSSKSVLKRSIDQVTESTDGSAAPDVKKSNIVSEEEDTESSEDVSSTVVPSDNLKTPVKPSRAISNVSAINIPSPRMLIMSPSSPPSTSKCPPPVLESTRLSPSPVRDGESNKEEREDLKKSLKEEVRVIAAKDLAEDRKLEKRRLNKLLTIFDDQKPVK